MSALRKGSIAKINSQYTVQHEKNEENSRKNNRMIIKRLMILLGIIGVFGYFIISTLISQIDTLQAKVLEKDSLEQALVQLKEERMFLEEEIVKLNDDEYIAKLARRDYFLSKENEIIFSIQVEDKQNESN